MWPDGAVFEGAFVNDKAKRGVLIIVKSHSSTLQIYIASTLYCSSTNIFLRFVDIITIGIYMAQQAKNGGRIS